MFGYPGIDLQDKCWILLAKYNLKMLILTCGINGSYVFTPGVVSFQESREFRLPIRWGQVIPLRLLSVLPFSMENRYQKLTNLPLKFLLMSARKAVQCLNFRRF